MRRLQAAVRDCEWDPAPRKATHVAAETSADYTEYFLNKVVPEMLKLQGHPKEAVLRGLSNFNPTPANGGRFYVGGADNAYSTPKLSLTPRHVLSLVGGQDTSVPALGGRSLGYTFVNWEASAYAYARAYGFPGNWAARSRDDNYAAQLSYLGGRVQVRRPACLSCHLCCTPPA